MRELPPLSDDIPDWVLARYGRRGERLKARKRAFVAQYPGDYPEPRLEQEWQAYTTLRRWWTRPMIRQFVATYGTDDMLKPGILNTARGPSYHHFMELVGRLAEGEFARTLPAEDRQRLLAGRDAARGRKNQDALIEGRGRHNHEEQARARRQYQEWQRMADEIWRERPELTNTRVGQIIAARCLRNDPASDANPDTIRRKIKRK